MEKKKMGVIGIIVILACAMLAYYVHLNNVEENSLFSVEYKTDDGGIVNEKGQTLNAMIGNTIGITDVRFKIKVINDGEVPFTARILSSVPDGLTRALETAQGIDIPVGAQGSWTTEWMPIDEYVGKVTDFEIVVEVTDLYSRSIVKEGKKTLDVKEDPVLSFGLEVSSSDDGASTDTSEDGNPETCTDECSFNGMECIGGDAYECQEGIDGCTNKVLIQECETLECINGACVEYYGSPIVFEVSPVISGLATTCTFNCIESYRDCIGVMEYVTVDSYGPHDHLAEYTVPKGTTKDAFGVKISHVVCSITKYV